jgi:hypothetical protein
MSGIFQLEGDDRLVEMREEAYDSEELLQQLLAKHPNLLAGDQVDPVAPRRWLLVCREMPVPDEEDGSGRWALDHLFLDQDAVPTLVEVKRSDNTLIRREVVGQMLDYAANAVVYWPVEMIRARYEQECQKKGVDPAKELDDRLGEKDGDGFWQTAKTNLRAGRVRLIFVADDIPAELRRVVEFLNTQMDPAEVLAVEVRQYVGGDGRRTLVPRVIGQATKADVRQWDEPSFFADLEARTGATQVRAARAILDWANRSGLRIWWGKGRKDGSFTPMLDHKGVKHFVVSTWSSGRVSIPFQTMETRQPFAADAKREELRERFIRIEGVRLQPAAIGGFPSILLALLANDAALQLFLDALSWYIAEIKAT